MFASPVRDSQAVTRTVSKKMEDTALDSKNFSMKQARQIVGDLHAPNPWIYWPDLLITAICGHL
ncbi:MAG: hypothetical protein ACKO8U_18730, partial [Pirellula sp.]